MFLTCLVVLECCRCRAEVEDRDVCEIEPETAGVFPKIGFYLTHIDEHGLVTDFEACREEVNAEERLSDSWPASDEVVPRRDVSAVNDRVKSGNADCQTV